MRAQRLGAENDECLFPSFKGRIQREIGIQLELIAGTAVYVYEFSRRQAAKLGAKA